MSPVGAGYLIMELAEFYVLLSFFLRTWAWGNQFLWQYKKDDDLTLKGAFDYMASNNLINWYDTADSYGTGIYVVVRAK